MSYKYKKTSKKGKYGKLVGNVSKIKNIVKKEIAKKEEYKNHITETTGTQDTTPTLICLTSIGLGDSIESRTGNETISRSLSFKYTIEQNASATKTWVRCIVFRDNLGNGGDPTAFSSDSTDILRTVPSVAYIPVEHKSEYTKKRYIVLYDKVTSINSVTNPIVFREYYKKLNSVKVKWYDGTNTHRLAGHYWVLFVSSEATNTPTITWQSKYKFTEL